MRLSQVYPWPDLASGSLNVLVNETQREDFISRNAYVTFSLVAAKADDPPVSTDVTLPYHAFDEIASYPLTGASKGSVRYFPLKSAASDDQDTLRGTFLPET